MSKKIKRTSAQQEAYDDLKKFMKRGETVYCVLRHVSRSGMSRRIDLYVIRHGEPRYITYSASVLVGDRRRNEYPGDGITVGGCGMDMGFELVYRLGYALYPNGIKLRKGERHNNLKIGDKYDGGYAFKHRWI